jgi:hypothetical protein
LIEQGLKPTGGSIEEEGFYSVGHILFYHRGHRGSRRTKMPWSFIFGILDSD